LARLYDQPLERPFREDTSSSRGGPRLNQWNVSTALRKSEVSSGSKDSSRN